MADRPKPPPPASTARAAARRDYSPVEDTGTADWMEGVKGPIPRDEYERWLTVFQAVAAFNARKLQLGTFGPRLLKRLHDGDIIAAVDSITLRTESRDPVTEYHRCVEPSLWAKASPDTAFWTLGELDIALLRLPSHRSRYYTLRGVRFSPEDIERMLGPNPLSPLSPTKSTPETAGSAPLTADEPPPVKSDEPAVERKPVSNTTLDAWWAMCKTLPEANLWSIDDLRGFFTQCFPTRTVTRDRLRDVRGRQKSGPKLRAAD